MNIIRISFIFVVLMAIGIHEGSAVIDDIMSVIKYSAKGVKYLRTGLKTYKKFTDKKPKDEKIDIGFQNISNKIDSITRQFSNFEIEMDDLKNEVKRIKYTTWKNNFGDKIFALEKELENLENKFEQNNAKTICKTVDRILNFQLREISKISEEIEALLAPGHSLHFFEGLNDMLIEVAENDLNNHCDEKRSLQQEAYDLYEYLVAIELKALASKIEVYDIEENFCSKNNENYEAQRGGLRKETVLRIQKYIEAFKKGLVRFSPDIYQCQPKQYKEDETHFELVKLMYRYPIMEYDLFGNCEATCDLFERHKPTNTNENKDKKTLQKEKCGECLPMGEYKLCHGESNDRHRYSVYNVTLDNHGKKEVITRGRIENYPQSSCEPADDEINPPSSQGPMFFGMSKLGCQPCACLCTNFESNDEFRYAFSLKPVEVGNRYKSEVITGVRFNKQFVRCVGTVIYIQVKKAELVAGNPGLLSNEKYEEFKPYGPGENEKCEKFKKTEKFKETYKYIGIDDDQVKYVALDDITVPVDCVIVGLELFVYKNKTHNGEDKIGIIAQGRRYNAEKHRLEETLPHTYAPGGRSSEVPNSKMKIPTEAKNVLRDSKDGQFIKFTTTDVYEDFSQTTIPFFDMQKVETVPAAPLSGISLYHKRGKNYGGFLTMKIMTFNRTHFMNSVIPQQEMIKLDAAADGSRIDTEDN